MHLIEMGMEPHLAAEAAFKTHPHVFTSESYASR